MASEAVKTEPMVTDEKAQYADLIVERGIVIKWRYGMTNWPMPGIPDGYYTIEEVEAFYTSMQIVAQKEQAAEAVLRVNESVMKFVLVTTFLVAEFAVGFGILIGMLLSE